MVTIHRTPPVHVSVKEHTQPKFSQLRPVQQESWSDGEGVLTKVEFSHWTILIVLVPVLKEDGSVPHLW